MHALRGSGEDGSEYIFLYIAREREKARESVALLCYFCARGEKGERERYKIGPLFLLGKTEKVNYTTFGSGNQSRDATENKNFAIGASQLIR